MKKPLIYKVLIVICLVCLAVLNQNCSGNLKTVTGSATGGSGNPDPETPTDPVGPTDPGNFAWVTGLNTTPPTNMSKPGLNVPYIDPIYKTKITMVTSASQVTDDIVPEWIRHEYSRRPAFNVDSSYALMIFSNGGIGLYSVDKANNKMTYVKSLKGGGTGTEPNWHPTDPNIFYFFDQNGLGTKIYRHDVQSNTSTTYRDLGSRIKALFPNSTGIWTKEEGRPSNDGKIWCLQVGGPNWSVVGLISYNIETDQIIGSLATPGDKPDHVSTSPKGNYCVGAWGHGTGTRAYSLNFASYTQLHNTGEHSDLAITKEGKEVYVYTDYGTGPDAGFVVMVDMATGTKTRLFALYGSNHSFASMHLSGFGTAKKPGYIAVSLYGCGEDYGNIPCNPNTQWFYNKIIMVELKANPTIYNVAHTQYADAGYWSETQASSNSDFTKILFVSTWRSTSENSLATYMIDVPALP